MRAYLKLDEGPGFLRVFRNEAVVTGRERGDDVLTGGVHVQAAEVVSTVRLVAESDLYGEGARGVMGG